MIRPEDIKALRKIRSITTRAERFAELAHAGQFRRGTEQPYIEHCRRVARVVEVEIRRYLKDSYSSAGEVDQCVDECVAAAFMHDVIEDTKVTVDTVLEAGFSKSVAHLINSLTRTPNQKYDDFITAIVTSWPSVKIIKICDIVDNLTDKPSNAQVEKYRRAIITLSNP